MTTQLPIINFNTASGSSIEGNSGGNQTVTVYANRNISSATELTIPITVSGSAASGSDYTGLPAEIFIAANSLSGSATFSVVGDSTVESYETLVLSMSAPAGTALGSNTTYTHTIIDNDLTISFSTTSGSTTEVLNGSSKYVFVSAQLNDVSSADVIVPITYAGSTATLGTDYTDPPTSITIVAGSRYGTASFAVLGDTTAETSEAVTLTMGTPTGATLGTNPTYTHTITDNTNFLPTVSFTTEGGASNEGNSGGTQTITVTAQLSSAATSYVSVPITFTGSATATDYTFSNAYNIGINQGFTTGFTSFTVNGDVTSGESMKKLESRWQLQPVID